MTPNDVATNVSSAHEGGSVGLSTNFTYSWQGHGQAMDDSNTWDH